MADISTLPNDYTPTDVLWLPEDLTGEKSSNWITDEIHPIVSLNQSDQRLILTPFYGAFYYDNYPLTSYVSDVDPDTGEANPATHQESNANAMPTKHLTIILSSTRGERELVRDSDYQVRGLDFGRTQASSSKYGVYNYIFLTQDLVNTLDLNDNPYFRISYHAFGGNAIYRHLIETVLDLKRRVQALEGN